MTQRRASPLHWAPAVTVAAFALPIVAGLLGTLLPAFGVMPAIGAERFGLAPWRELAYPHGEVASLETLLQRVSGQRVLALSPDVYPIYPALNYLDEASTLPAMSTWVLQASYATCLPGGRHYRDVAEMQATLVRERAEFRHQRIEHFRQREIAGFRDQSTRFQPRHVEQPGQQVGRRIQGAADLRDGVLRNGIPRGRTAWP